MTNEKYSELAFICLVKAQKYQELQRQAQTPELRGYYMGTCRSWQLRAKKYLSRIK